MLNHCLEWNKFVLRTHLPTPDRGLTYTCTRIIHTRPWWNAHHAAKQTPNTVDCCQKETNAPAVEGVGVVLSELCPGGDYSRTPHCVYSCGEQNHIFCSRLMERRRTRITNSCLSSRLICGFQKDLNDSADSQTMLVILRQRTALIAQPC